MKLINNLLIGIIPFFPKSFIKIFASPYIAGITDDEMLSTVANLNQEGYDVAIDILGEHVNTEKEATEITNRYSKLYDEISSRALNANLSIKLTHIGQDLGYDVVKNNLMILTEKAKEHKNFLRLDMENSPYTSETIKLYKEALGIYIENKDIVYDDYQKIRENYIELVKMGLERGSYIGIASHDEYLINYLYEWIKNNSIPKTQYEFQVLHGVPMKKTLEKLLKEGNKIRIYVPYGDNWYDYSVRRLKENPKMAGYIISNIVKRIFYFYK